MITKRVKSEISIDISKTSSRRVVGIIVGEDVSQGMISAYISELPNQNCTVVYSKDYEGITPVYNIEDLKKLMEK